jgi:hypothetical protein
MSLVISKVFTYDTDAGNYIQAVEAADGQALEPATRQAINNFVIGCKQDGIWSAIKASCILSGARTLNGALQPLVGTAPTNNGPFVTGDYNRKTGLVGNGTTKYLDSNRNNNADPQNSNHNALYITNFSSGTQAYMGADPPTNSTGTNNIGRTADMFFRNRINSFASVATPTAPSLVGTNRSAFETFFTRAGGVSISQSFTSQTPFNGNMTIFASGGTGFRSSARLAFYSIGESLDLALLDARVTALITAFGVAIP